MLFSGDRANEILEDETETVLRLRGRESRRARLLAQDQFDFRNDLRYHASVDVESFGELGTPCGQTIFAFGQQLLDETSKRLDQCAERCTASNLVELARDEIPALSNDGLVQLLNQRGLSDTCI